MTNDKEKPNYCAIIETTLTNQKGEKKTFFPEKIEGLNNDCPLLTMRGTYQDGTKWTKQINKSAILSIDIVENNVPEEAESSEE